jgi:cold shock CspA family protein
MQATVSRFDEASGAGAVLCDDGLEVPFDADVFTSAGARTIRVGQRVGVEMNDDGRSVRALWLATMSR